jgi:hypothetical protein
VYASEVHHQLLHAELIIILLLPISRLLRLADLLRRSYLRLSSLLHVNFVGFAVPFEALELCLKGVVGVAGALEGDGGPGDDFEGREVDVVAAVGGGWGVVEGAYLGGRELDLGRHSGI